MEWHSGIYRISVVIAVEDGELGEISLVYSPAEFVSKSAAAQVICKVFVRGAREVQKPSGRRRN
jgi:hypothetical protein